VHGIDTRETPLFAVQAKLVAGRGVNTGQRFRSFEARGTRTKRPSTHNSAHFSAFRTGTESCSASGWIEIQTLSRPVNYAAFQPIFFVTRNVNPLLHMQNYED
jgi:hypothetical protein